MLRFSILAMWVASLILLSSVQAAPQGTSQNESPLSENTGLFGQGSDSFLPKSLLENSLQGQVAQRESQKTTQESSQSDSTTKASKDIKQAWDAIMPDGLTQTSIQGAAS